MADKGQETAIQILVCNDFQENTILLYKPKGNCLIVDCGCLYDEDWAVLTRLLEEHELTPSLLFNTHGHIDHIYGVQRAREQWGIPFAMHPGDNEILEIRNYPESWTKGLKRIDTPDMPVEDGQAIDIQGFEAKVIHTPGHSPGGCCLYFPELGVLFSGDTLFDGSIGRTDLPGGDHQTLINSIRQKLFTLPGDTVVIPGHGPTTTIAKEKRSNPFLL